ncbi:MAG TPA: CVNH domain-containing protein [Stellaceae bacterium]
MKRGTTVLAGLLLAGIAWMQPATAQGLPHGTYLRSCTGAMLRGDTLVATCQRADGREQRTSLADVRRCVGDIGNNNGNLQCNYGGGRAGPGPGYEERHYGQPGYGERGYGERRYGEEARERCFGLRREADDLRIRLDREFNPMERARTEGRLREVREQEERVGCRR